jgi:hypothetical protein
VVFVCCVFLLSLSFIVFLDEDIEFLLECRLLHGGAG